MSAAIDRWVARVNKAAREMDEAAASMHPSAWPEALKSQREAFKKLCAAPTIGDPSRMMIGFDLTPMPDAPLMPVEEFAKDLTEMHLAITCDGSLALSRKLDAAYRRAISEVERANDRFRKSSKVSEQLAAEVERLKQQVEGIARESRAEVERVTKERDGLRERLRTLTDAICEGNNPDDCWRRLVEAAGAVRGDAAIREDAGEVAVSSPDESPVQPPREDAPDHEMAMRTADYYDNEVWNGTNQCNLARAYKELVRDALTPEEAEALTFAIKRSEVVFDTDETATHFGNGYLKLLRRIAARAATKKPEGKDHEADRLDLRHDSGRRHV